MKGLIGSRGFVGSNLLRQTAFERTFNSDSIASIGEDSYELVVCAAPSATMWLANARPDEDRSRTEAFIERLREVRTERFVLISTIAVFDDPAGGYDEVDCAFETARAYGKHRRMIEVAAAEIFEQRHVLRLPALFGPGLKKNFVFDLMNPVPTYLKSDTFETLVAQLPSVADTLRAAFAPDAQTGMMRYDRGRFARTAEEAELVAALEAVNHTARVFTNSDSTFQYYNLANLWRDIERCIALDIDLLNVCSEPLRAGVIHEALLGRPWHNADAPLRHEAVRTRHSAAWNAPPGYLYRADQTLDELQAFCHACTR
jgi:dTDP-4-dehydrorhamnose reductase